MQRHVRCAIAALSATLLSAGILSAQCHNHGGGYNYGGGHQHYGGWSGGYSNYGHSHTHIHSYTPSYSTASIVPSQPVVISMPDYESGQCSYTLRSSSGSYDYSILPGKRQTIDSGNWTITFPGANGATTYTLYGGEYRFRHDSSGNWQLYRTGAAAVARSSQSYRPRYTPSYTPTYRYPSQTTFSGNGGYNGGGIPYNGGSNNGGSNNGGYNNGGGRFGSAGQGDGTPAARLGSNGQIEYGRMRNGQFFGN